MNLLKHRAGDIKIRSLYWKTREAQREKNICSVGTSHLKSQLYPFFTKYLDRCGEPPYSHFIPLQNAWCKSPSPNYTKFNSLITRFTDPQMSHECQWWHYCHGQHKNKITTTKAALPSALCQQGSHWKVSNALIFQRSQTCPHGLSVQLSVSREA